MAVYGLTTILFYNKINLNSENVSYIYYYDIIS